MFFAGIVLFLLAVLGVPAIAGIVLIVFGLRARRRNPMFGNARLIIGSAFVVLPLAFYVVGYLLPSA